MVYKLALLTLDIFPARVLYCLPKKLNCLKKVNFPYFEVDIDFLILNQSEIQMCLLCEVMYQFKFLPALNSLNKFGSDKYEVKQALYKAGITKSGDIAQNTRIYSENTMKKYQCRSAGFPVYKSRISNKRYNKNHRGAYKWFSS